MGKKATMCFVFYKDKVLMINRNKSPFMGMWNVVGGHVDENESEEDCIKREIFEESGIKVSSVVLQSVFTWNYDDEIGYAYCAYLPDDFDISSYPEKTEEGIVEFKDVSWVIDNKNYGVIEDLRIFLSDIKSGIKQDYHLIYKDKKLKKAIRKVNH